VHERGRLKSAGLVTRQKNRSVGDSLTVVDAATCAYAAALRPSSSAISPTGIGRRP
jgi:hypothetical protein